MSYEKRICVLKQIRRGFTADGSALTGAVYAERLGDELTVTCKIAGIAPLSEGRYALVLWAGGKLYCTEFAKSIRLPDVPSLSAGFAALLCFVRGEAEPIAFGSCANAPRDYTVLLNAFDATAVKPEKRRREKISERAGESAPSEAKEEEASADCFRKQPYDDEAIAAADYYRLSESAENADAAVCAQEESGKEPCNQHSCEDDGVPPHGVSRGTLAYYREVKEKLDEAFSRFPKDERLQKVFPQSEWVRSENALLGVVYEHGVPRYLCVAAEGEDLPEGMKEHGVFVPEPFTDEKGWFVVFQDADSGEYVTVSLN